MYKREGYTMKDSTYEGLLRYAQHGVMVGDFLYAVLTNDLFGAYDRADTQNTKDLEDICRFIYNELPKGCWGSKEAISNWLERFRKEE